MNHIYQLRIVLRDSNPKIWRIIQIAEDTSFSDLHDIIQLTMGWENEHLYKFIVNGVSIVDFEGEFDDGSDPTVRDSMDTFLNEMVSIINSKFTYIYDFGDNWEHEIMVEKIIPTNSENPYPTCLNGKRACPPEASGGIWGYQELLNIVSEKEHPQYEETISWLGEEWDADAFNLEHVNILLTDYAEQWEEIYKETDKILDDLEENYVDEEDWDDEEWDDYQKEKRFSNSSDIPLEENNDTEEFKFPDSFEEDLKEILKLPPLNSVQPLIKNKTLGRNDPCHCGSGRKYKKCCMDKDGKNS